MHVRRVRKTTSCIKLCVHVCLSKSKSEESCVYKVRSVHVTKRVESRADPRDTVYI
jgi:hypothetical protein